MRDHLGQQGHAVGPLPDRVGVGEVPAEVAEADGAQHGVGQRVADGVGVAVAAQAAGALDHDAAEHERAVRVLGEAVDVDALADAHAHPSRDASRRSAAPRSSGSVILRLRGLAGHDPHACRRAPRPAWRRRWPPASGPRRGPGAARRPGTPGGLDGDQRAAVQRAGDVAGAVHRLDRVTRRDTGHGSVHAVGAHGGDHGGEQRRRRQRPGRVVHHDHLGVVGDRGQPAAHRVGPGGPAGDDDVGAVAVRGRRTGRRGARAPRRRKRAGTPRRPTRAPGGRRAAENCLRSPKRRARATGHDDRPHLRHGATGPVDQVSASFRRSSAVSSSTLRAKVSSDTRIWRARCSMRFSPADRPLSLSRMERFRTTSATW